MTIAALVLAAGSPSRLGTPKQLLPVEGRPLVRHVVEAATASSCDAVAVVLGAHAPRIESAIGALDVVFLPNARWIEGMASSIRTGVAWADAGGFDGVMVLVSDQLRITTTHLDALLRAHREDGRPTASLYCDVLGVPAIFPHSHFGALMALVGDRGARDVLRDAGAVTAVDWHDGANVEVPHSVTRLRLASPPARRGRRTTPRARARSR